MADMEKMRGMMQQMKSMMDEMMSMMDGDMDDTDMGTMRSVNMNPSDPKHRAMYAKEKMRMNRG
ncbi:MAG: hypothetical protein NUV34_10045 [Sulfuricaulis sp.]|nr:hypothetical protein [Sulfuricaulis sp.]